jgi:EAL domain-containing protein (putative c-di-GMP-specific phosphodiesterase class I)
MSGSHGRGCADCEALPEALPDAGFLHLAAPLSRTGERLRKLLRRSGLAFEEAESGVITVQLPPQGLEKLALDLAGLLTAGEQLECPCLLSAERGCPGLGELLRTQPLSRVVGRVRGEWVRQLLAEQRLVTHFQPIVEARAPESVFAHECLVRGRERNGALVTPSEVQRAARAAGLLFQFDRAARLQAVRSAARRDLPGQVFVNVNPNAVHDPATCLRTTLDAAAEAGIDHERLVFEITETEDVADATHLAKLLAYCRHHGFRVALDDLGAGFSSVRLLRRLKPDFVKLDRELVEGIDRDAFKARFVEKLLDVARSLAIPIIAEGVETAQEWRWVEQHEVDYVQGFYVAAPDDPPRPPRRSSSRRPA